MSRVSGVTREAIRLYEKRARAERKVEELALEHNTFVAMIPGDELDYYLEKTKEIAEREDEKLEAFMKRWYERRRR